MKVIVRSNEDEPLWVGIYVGRDAEHHNIPIVVNDQKEPFLVAGIILPYDELVLKMLQGLSNKEQWQALAAIKRFWADLCTGV